MKRTAKRRPSFSTIFYNALFKGIVATFCRDIIHYVRTF